MQAATARNGNPGPIADGAAALAQARRVLASARVTLNTVTAPQAHDKQLLQVYVQAKQAAGALTSAAADPRTGHTAEYSSAAVLAKQAAVAVGQAIVSLRIENGQSAHAVNATARRLHAASETLGMAYIGAMTGANG